MCDQYELSKRSNRIFHQWISAMEKNKCCYQYKSSQILYMQLKTRIFFGTEKFGIKKISKKLYEICDWSKKADAT